MLRRTILEWLAFKVTLFDYVCVQHTVLLQVMRDCILRQKRRLQPDFSADPFAFGVRRVQRVVATSSAAKLRTEIRALDLIKLTDLAPGFVAHRARDIDL